MSANEFRVPGGTGCLLRVLGHLGREGKSEAVGKANAKDGKGTGKRGAWRSDARGRGEGCRHPRVFPIEARHLCMMVRGVRRQCSKMVTSALAGCFQTSVATRNGFMHLVHSAKED